MINQSELIKYFLLEAEEYINTLIEGLEDLDNRGYSKETVEALYRATHTLKGSAAIVKFNKIATLSHKLEDLFEALLNNSISFETSVIRIAKNIVNTIINFLSEVTQFSKEKSDLDNDLLKLVDNLIEGKIDTVQKNLLVEEVTTVSTITNSVRVDLRQIENLIDILSEVIVQKNIIVDRDKEIKNLVEEILNSGKKLFNEIIAFSDRQWLSPLDKHYRVLDSFFTDFSDLEFDRYDEYHIFTRKIAEFTNDINEGLNELLSFYENLSFNFKTLGKEINNLKENLLAIRMIPIGRLLNKLAEAIKDSANNLGKKINIEIKGSDIKIDKPIFDSLYEPLIHLLRNAVDHGIESSEIRQSLGKSTTGNIRLHVKKEGKYIIISISDDGKGIDIEKVKEIAINKKLINPDDINSISKQEILSYIFAPGFSTSEDVDFQSGRGMGLNIVKTAITKLKGSIEILSEINKGTTFIIKIPQSLTISNLLIFSCSNVEFAVPINYIEEILSAEDFPEIKNEKKIFHKNRVIPVKFFSDLYSFSEDKKPFDNYILVFNFSGIRKALIIENILGQEEAYIITFGKFLEGLNLYLGYILSSTGKPRFVIDPLRLFEEEFIFIPSESKFTDKAIYSGSILVVDDSISVRRSLQTLLEAKNLKVYTAKDGLEALGILENNSVDIVITDLEMPVMHGYDLISRIRKDPKNKDLPIIVLTSRGTKKHQEKAIDLGADGFIIKPFDEKTITDFLVKFQILKNYVF